MENTDAATPPTQIQQQMESSYEWIERENQNQHQQQQHDTPNHSAAQRTTTTTTSTAANNSITENQGHHLPDQSGHTYAALRPSSLAYFSSPMLPSTSTVHNETHNNKIHSEPVSPLSPFSPILSLEGFASLSDIVNASPYSVGSVDVNRIDENEDFDSIETRAVDVTSNTRENMSHDSHSAVTASSSDNISASHDGNSTGSPSSDTSSTLIEHIRTILKVPSSVSVSRIVSVLSWFAIGAAVGALVTRSYYLRQMPLNQIQLPSPVQSPPPRFQVLIHEFSLPRPTPMKFAFDELCGLYRGLFPFNLNCIHRLISSPFYG